MKPVGIFLLLALAACDIPRDQAGTLERVRAEGEFRVGLASGPHRAVPATPYPFLRGITARTGAEPAIVLGSFERLLSQLDRGELDLVIGEVEKTSPWSKKVTLVKPPLLITQSEPAAELQLSAIARNGENGWIALLNQEAKAFGEGNGAQ